MRMRLMHKDDGGNEISLQMTRFTVHVATQLSLKPQKKVMKVNINK